MRRILALRGGMVGNRPSTNLPDLKMPKEVEEGWLIATRDHEFFLRS